MKNTLGTSALVGAVALAVGLLPGTATAQPTTASAACRLDLGSVSATGDHQMQGLVATSPPTNEGNRVVISDLYPDGQARLHTAMVQEPTASGLRTFGHVVIGSVLYRSSYDSFVPESVQLRRIGGGWDSFIALEEARYAPYGGSFTRTNNYGLRNDGVLFRWTRDAQGNWGNKVSTPGFSAVKSMTLISKTRTYDTFLANTTTGTLITIHIPTTTPMKPVVKRVRSSTWQGFESLVAERCGTQGTVLVGIDKDTKSAYLYTMSRADGTSTVIRGLGKIPATVNAPVHFRWATLDFDEMYGE
jgi:hypothetical protein